MNIVAYRLAVALTSRQLYGECIGWFYMVFKAFEASIDASRKNEHVTKLHQTFDQLRRTEAFEADLKFYLGQDQWKDKLTVPAGGVQHPLPQRPTLARVSRALLCFFVTLCFPSAFSLDQLICSTYFDE